MAKIKKVTARQILDSRGNPTVEVDVILDTGVLGRAAVPSGASTGDNEALELRDNDKGLYCGKGVLKAVNNVNTVIASKIKGLTADFNKIDRVLIDLDGTENKSNLGANAILGVSMATAKAAAQSKKQPLYKFLGGPKANILPVPLMNIMNGGKHANWSTDIQEYMVIPQKSKTWADSLRIGSEIFHSLEELLKEKNYSVNVGNEGGFAPSLTSNQEALDLIVEAIGKANYKLDEEIKIGFDAAASEFYNEQTNQYELKRDNVQFDRNGMLEWVLSLSNKYPVASFEDMFSQDDWEAWSELTKRVGDKIQVVGDDLLVTNVERINEAIGKKACNALLVKVNQIGSLTETLNAMKLSQSAGWNNVVSHRSGETEDVTIAHIVVGTGCKQIKAGAPSRSERVTKYNELLRIEEQLNNN